MSIEEGIYYIYSALDDIQVGRLRVEDRTFLPKRVVSLAPGERPNNPWTVIKRGDKLVLKAGGAPTAGIDDKVYAILLDTPEATEWTLSRADNHKDNAYAVMSEDGVSGWVLPTSDPYTQIEVRPLIAGPSDPPTHPATEVFIFVKINGDDD
ncbi:proteinase inhibitor [Irpex lacteus]|nr:proteinase inhibitor [Irpex lacteus]